MSDQPPDRPHRQLEDRGRERAAEAEPCRSHTAGTLTVAVAVAIGVDAASGQSDRASLSSEVKAPTQARW